MPSESPQPVFDPGFSVNPGCPQRISLGGPPRQCGGRERWAVPWRYTYPTEQVVRLYVCEEHSELAPSREPLTALDRATIAGRRAKRRAQLERAGRLDLIGGPRTDGRG